MTQVLVTGARTQGELDLCFAAKVDAVGLLIEENPGPEFMSAEEARSLLIKRRFKGHDDPWVLSTPLPLVCVTHLRDARMIVALLRYLRVCSYVELCAPVSQRGIRYILRMLPYVQVINVLGVIPGRSQPYLRDHMQLYVQLGADIEFDTVRPEGGVGGTGKTHDFGVSGPLIREAARYPQRRTLIAGGLTAINVEHAIEVTGADAVNVSTGIRGPDGRISEEALLAFVKAVKPRANYVQD